MKRVVLSVSALFLVLVGCFCWKSVAAEGSSDPTEARRVLVRWLECEECTEGELEAVVKLGTAVVPSLAASLREGPSEASRELVRRHLTANYKELRKYEAVPTEKEYVKIYIDNYVALYRVRSATALAAIGGPEAKKALEEASRADLREDVSAAIEESLKNVGKR